MGGTTYPFETIKYHVFVFNFQLIGDITKLIVAI